MRSNGASAANTDNLPYVAENRGCPRFKLETPICIYRRDDPVIRGFTVDLSLSGIAVMLREHLVLGELVRLKFTLDHTPVDVFALVRQHNAFRYGLQFVEAATPADAIGRAWRQLYIEQAGYVPNPL